jgi:hypothetical protein
MAAGETVTVQAVDGEQSFPTQLSIAAGQRVGIDILEQPALAVASIVNTSPSAGSFDLWQPSLGTPESRGPSMTSMNAELLVNADVEADVDNDGYGDETQDACPDVASRHLEPCHDPPPTTDGGGGGSSGGSGGSTGSTGVGGASGVGTIGATGPPVVTAPPPLAKPKTKRKSSKSKRCTRKAKRAHRCPKRKRKHRRSR